MRTTSRRVLAATTALTATLGLTACGSQDGGESASTPSTASAPSATSASAQATVGDTVPLAELAQRARAAMTKAGTVKAVMSNGSTGDMKMQMDYRDGLSYRMTGEANGQPVDVRYVDKVVYVSMGSQTAQVTGGKKWLKIDGTGTDPMSKAFAGSMHNMEQAADPAAMYQDMSDVRAKVVAADGSRTTYQATITSATMQEMLKKKLARSGSGSSPTSIPSMGPMTLTQTYDQQGRVTKATVKSSTTGEQTITYSGWGEPVEVTAPPASEVGSFDTSRLGGSTASPTG